MIRNLRRNRLVDLLDRDRMTLIVSLPRNQVDLAAAAIQGGAEALKVHLNLHHDASGTHFGTLKEERSALEAILEKANGTPVGVVAGASDPAPDDSTFRSEIQSLASMGFDFVDMYAHHLPAWMCSHQEMSLVAAIDNSYSVDDLLSLNDLPHEAVEAAVIPHSGYGQGLSLRDLMQYHKIFGVIEAPLIIPTQRLITPEDVLLLSDLGFEALMIGAIVTGVGPANLEKAAALFRRVIDGAGSLGGNSYPLSPN